MRDPRPVLRALARAYPASACALRHEGALQLLVSTILSAQCTDKRVNQVTPALFARFPDAEALASAPAGAIERIIRPTGFFRTKAKSIRSACRDLVERHGGEVPGRMEDLIRLRGVGRKTANVVLGNAFGIPGITVDTHLGRISRRLGWTRHEDPVKAERDLMRLWPEKDWTRISHRMIDHGRAVCHARKPDCPTCPLARWCPSRRDA